MQSLGRRGVGCALALLLAAGVGCSRTKRLSGEGDGVVESVLYGVLGMDRNATDYYRIVRESHDRRFGYRVSSEEFQIDRVVDAVQRLGELEYEQWGGQAQVVSLLCDVLLEDPSALARASAATSLARLDLKLPRIVVRRVAERGERLLALLRELDGLHAAGRAPTAAVVSRSVRIVDEVGAMQLPTVGLAQDALKPFFTRAYLVETSDAALRRASDRALVLRMREVTRLALRAAIDAETDFVREEVLRGLKTIGDREAEPQVIARLRREPDPRVRAEAVEFLGMSGGARAVSALVPLLEDADPSLRIKARESLTRIAGRDLGIRPSTWTRWAKERFPGFEVPARPSAPSPRGR